MVVGTLNEKVWGEECRRMMLVFIIYPRVNW